VLNFSAHHWAAADPEAAAAMPSPATKRALQRLPAQCAIGDRDERCCETTLRRRAFAALIGRLWIGGV
jgi:hypothetical protein